MSLENYELEEIAEAMEQIKMPLQIMLGGIKSLLEDEVTQSSIKDLSTLIAKMTMDSVKAFEEAGFVREEAITLTAALLSKGSGN